MALRSITESSGRGPNSVVQNPDQRDFSSNMENTPPMMASSRADVSFDHDRNDETHNVENFEDCNFSVLRLNGDRQPNSHHIYRKRKCSPTSYDSITTTSE